MAGDKPSTMTKSRFRVLINIKWCKGCGICMAFCPKGILAAEGFSQKATVTDESQCIGCTMCEIHCPDFAIEVVKEEGV